MRQGGGPDGVVQLLRVRVVGVFNVGLAMRVAVLAAVLAAVGLAGLADAGDGRSVILHTHVVSPTPAEAVMDAAESVAAALEAAYEGGAVGTRVLDYVFHAGDGFAAVSQLTEVAFDGPDGASFAAAVNADGTSAYVLGRPWNGTATPQADGLRVEPALVVFFNGMDVFDDRVSVFLTVFNRGDDAVHSLLLDRLVIGDLHVGQAVNVTGGVYGETHGTLSIAGMVFTPAGAYEACFEEGVRPTPAKQKAHSRAGAHSLQYSHYAASDGCAGAGVKLGGLGTGDARLDAGDYQRMSVTIHADKGSPFDIAVAARNGDSVSVSVAGIGIRGDAFASKPARAYIDLNSAFEGR